MQTETCNIARFLPIRLVASTDRNIRAKGQRGFLTFSTLPFLFANAHSHIRTNAHAPIRTHTHDVHAHIHHDVRHAIRYRTAPPYIQNAHRLIRNFAHRLIHKMHGHIYIIAQGYIRLALILAIPCHDPPMVYNFCKNDTVFY